MLKTLLLVLGGLVAGLAIAYWVAPDAPPPLAAMTTAAVPTAAGSPTLAAATSGPSAARLAAVENALAAEVEHRAVLEQRVEEMAARLEELGQRAAAPRMPGAGFRGGGPPDPAAVAESRERLQRDDRARNDEADRRFVERLVAAGFAPDRANWLIRRTEELRMEALQAEYQAQRDGRPADPYAAQGALQAELGDADFERYLQAVGRPAAVSVRDILASSPAERVGLKVGDEIVAYGGKRVFDIRELNALTLEGTPGESVAVEVRRDGQNVQVVIPRGPLGITGGGFRGR